uniref:Methyltransferase-like protein 6 n=2 Tax=Hirondellea gigas TaxID=1518452 RepID=A0A6A7FQ43_9CRUS
MPGTTVDLITCIFVLSAVSPEEHCSVALNLARVSKPGTVLLFRDYAVNDMAMVRFKPGAKISDRFYVRQDGTRAYYFTSEELTALMSAAGFVCTESRYIHRRTMNIKEGVDAARVFLQAKFTYNPL